MQIIAYLGLLLVLLDPLMCTPYGCSSSVIVAPTQQVDETILLDGATPSDPRLPSPSFPLLHIFTHSHCSFTMIDMTIALIPILVIGWMLFVRHSIPLQPKLAPTLLPP